MPSSERSGCILTRIRSDARAESMPSRTAVSADRRDLRHLPAWHRACGLIELFIFQRNPIRRPAFRRRQGGINSIPVRIRRQWRYLSHPNSSTLARLDTAFEKRSLRFPGFPATRHAYAPSLRSSPPTQTSGSASVKLPTRTLNGRSKQLLMCADLSEPPADPKEQYRVTRPLRKRSARSDSPYCGPRTPRLTFGMRNAQEWHA